MVGKKAQILLNRIINDLENKYDVQEGHFYARLGMAFNGIYKRFYWLYGHRDDFEDYLLKLMEALLESYKDRPDEQKEKDKKREQDKQWFLSQKYTGTMLYVDLYSGDLKNLTDKIDYLKELGINLVHVMPVLKSPKGDNDGGYAVSDYRQIDSRYGTMEDFQEVVRQFADNGIILMMDLVLNHTSNEHRWAKKALKGDAKYQGYYYMYDNREIPDMFEQTMPEVFPDNAPGNFSYQKEIDKWVMTVFNRFQWDLNYTNPEVFIEMTKVVLNFSNLGVDVIRLDAVAFLWKKIGTSCQNLEEAHIILQALKECTYIAAPGTIFLAEAIVQPNEIVRYLGEGTRQESEIAYNAFFMVLLWDAVATKNTCMITKGLKALPRIPDGATWINYARCHDDIGLGFSDDNARACGYDPFMHRRFLVNYYTGRFDGSFATGAPFMENPKTGDARISGTLASLCGLEKALADNNEVEIEYSVRKILLLHAMFLAYGGIPMVYYGDEIGMTNDYRFIKDVAKKNDNRWMHRPLMDWSKAAKRKKKGSIEYRIFSGLKKMIAVRRKTPEMSAINPMKIIDNESPAVFIFERYLNKKRMFVIANFSNESQSFDPEVIRKAGFTGKLKDLLHDCEWNPEEKQSQWLKAYEYAWVRKQDS